MAKSSRETDKQKLPCFQAQQRRGDLEDQSRLSCICLSEAPPPPPTPFPPSLLPFLSCSSPSLFVASMNESLIISCTNVALSTFSNQCWHRSSTACLLSLWRLYFFSILTVNELLSGCELSFPLASSTQLPAVASAEAVSCVTHISLLYSATWEAAFPLPLEKTLTSLSRRTSFFDISG